MKLKEHNSCPYVRVTTKKIGKTVDTPPPLPPKMTIPLSIFRLGSGARGGCCLLQILLGFHE